MATLRTWDHNVGSMRAYKTTNFNNMVLLLEPTNFAASQAKQPNMRAYFERLPMK